MISIMRVIGTITIIDHEDCCVDFNFLLFSNERRRFIPDLLVLLLLVLLNFVDWISVPEDERRGICALNEY